VTPGGPDLGRRARALAEAGEGEEIGDKWPGGIRWRAEWDKKGYLTHTPLPASLRAILAAHTREKGVIGDAWLFADQKEATNKARAGYLLNRGEVAAGLPNQSRGGWHAFRRGWANRLKSLPVQDVMLAGGWRDVKAVQACYQGADSATTLAVMELAESA